MGCLRGLADGISEIVRAASSVFKLSGKEQGPGRSDL